MLGIGMEKIHRQTIQFSYPIYEDQLTLTPNFEIAEKLPPHYRVTSLGVTVTTLALKKRNLDAR